MRWASAANAAFGLPQGFFIAAYGADGSASMGVFPEPTSRLLTEVAETGVVPPITDDDRERARRDLSLWRADCVALANGPRAAALRSTLEQLLGPATPIADVWAWPVDR